MQFTPRPYQTEAIDRAVSFFQEERKYHAIEVLPTGCHLKSTEILLYDGTIKNVEDVRPGDQLMGPDSQPRNVISLCGGNEMMYMISPKSGGSSFIVNAGHILHLVSTNEGKKNVYQCYQKGGEVECISVANYLRKSKSWKHLRKLSRSKCVEFKSCEKQIPIPAWILGALLGDGSFCNGVVSVTTMDPEIADSFFAYSSSIGCDIVIDRKKDNRASSYKIVKKRMKRHRAYENALMRKILSLGLGGKRSGDKFIPFRYKVASERERLELLAGLIDTDGSHNGIGGYDYISKSPQLATDVCFVARSLGLCATYKSCQKRDQFGRGGTYYRVHISGDTDKIPCRVARKKAPPRKQKKNWLLSGFSITQMGKANYYGFTLDHDHLYLTADFVIHHNSGKSIVVANIAKSLPGKTVVFQPSKEILEQNFAKFTSYGYRAAKYSASVGEKYVDDITFATIGSVARKHHLFSRFQNIIIDECHLTSPDGGMLHDFIKAISHAKVLGLTATPYRLTSDYEGAMLTFLNRATPRIFDEVIYYVQNEVLFNAGHLAKLEYFDFNKIDRTLLQLNSSGTDFTDASLRAYYRQIRMHEHTAYYANALLGQRKNVLVFCSLIDEAEKVARLVPGSVVITGATDNEKRGRILSEFKSGKIRCVINVGVLTTGFDFPELESVIIARSTMSLALYYQIVGRIMRPHPSKISGWVVDLGGNVRKFGKIETMEIRRNSKGQYSVWNEGRQLTNVPFSKS